MLDGGAWSGACSRRLRPTTIGWRTSRRRAGAADDVLHVRRLEVRLQQRIDALPELQRTAYRLLQQEGLSLKSAAEVLGTSVTAVKLRAHRAYVALRAVLREAGGAVVSAELRARVLAAAAAEASPTRAAVRRRNMLIGMVAAASGIGAFVIFAALMSESHLLRLGGEVAPHQRLERPVWLVVATAGGALGVAATAVWLALGRGRSMLGRSPRWLLYGGVLIPISLLAWKVGCSLAFGDAMVAWPERPGERCLSLSLARRGGAPVVIPRHPPERAGAAGAQRRGHGIRRRRVRVGRRGPLVSGGLCATPAARPRPAAVRARRRRRAARAGLPGTSVALTVRHTRAAFDHGHPAIRSAGGWDGSRSCSQRKPKKPKARQKKRQLTRRCLWRAGSNLDLKRAHNPKVAGSNPAPATMNDEGLADVEPLTPLLYPDFTRNCRREWQGRSDLRVVLTSSRRRS